MAPTLRSSTTNTPTRGSVIANNPSSTPSPRKAPTCTKCKRPRAGHPRSGCPYVDSPSNGGRAQAPSVAPSSIADAMESMQLESPSRERDEDMKAAVRSRRKSANQLVSSQTLLSLSSSSQDIVERLLQPGLLSEDADDPAKTVQWQETLLATPLKPKPRVKMPGSLFNPSIGSSQMSSLTPGNKQEPQAASEQGQSTQLRTEALPSPSSTARPARPLARSMSVQERDLFLSDLSQTSDATAYAVPAGDVHNLQASAIKVGFYARVVVNKDKDKGNLEALLVLGRDEKAVQRLFEKIVMERKKGSAGRLGAAAGGAMVGAVGAFAGLAFS